MNGIKHAKQWEKLGILVRLWFEFIKVMLELLVICVLGATKNKQTNKQKQNLHGRWQSRKILNSPCPGSATR